MKIILLVYFLFSTFVSVFAQPDSSPKDSYFPYFYNQSYILAKNNIKNEAIFLIRSTQQVSDTFITFNISYDHSGRKITSNKFAKENILFETVTTIDSNKNLKKTRFINYTKDQANKYNVFISTLDTTNGYFKQTWINERNNDSMIIEQTFLNNILPLSTIMTISDRIKFTAQKNIYENNRLTRELTYSSIGNIAYEYIYKYNQDFTQTTEEIKQNNRSAFVGTAIYNRSGQQIQMLMAIPNSKGNLFNKKWNKTHPPLTIEYLYNTDGTLKERNYIITDNIKIIEKRVYQFY